MPKTAVRDATVARKRKAVEIVPEPAELEQASATSDVEGDDEAGDHSEVESELGEPAIKSDVPAKGMATVISRLLQAQSSKAKKPGILAQSKSVALKLSKQKEFKHTKVAVVEKKAAREKEHRTPEEYSIVAEKMLRKLATKGVVQLFNAVSAQRKKVEAEATAAILDDKAAAQQKSSFLDTLNKQADIEGAPKRKKTKGASDDIELFNIASEEEHEEEADNGEQDLDSEGEDEDEEEEAEEEIEWA